MKTIRAFFRSIAKKEKLHSTRKTNPSSIHSSSVAGEKHLDPHIQTQFTNVPTAKVRSTDYSVEHIDRAMQGTTKQEDHSVKNRVSKYSSVLRVPPYR
jgi:hypothetical protein